MLHAMYSMTYLSMHRPGPTNRGPHFSVDCKQDDALLSFFNAYQLAAAYEATA
jgi:hypothetical protein